MAPNRASRTGDGSRLRVLLLLSWLNGGGAERVAVHLMNRSDPARFDMRMGLLRRAGPYLSVVDPDRLHHRAWGECIFPAGGDRSYYAPHRLAMSGIMAPLVYRSIIREARPDVVMSFAKGTNLVVGLAMKGTGRNRPAWIAREGNNVLRAIEDEASGPIGIRVATALTRNCYRSADCVLVDAREMIGNMHETWGVPAERLRAIHNPVDLDGVRKQAAEALPDPPRRPFVVAVGRLERQKGHDIMLRAFAASRTAAKHDLVIVGRGQRELIRHDVSGWLVPPDDPSALVAAFDRLLPDAALRARLAAGGKARAQQLRLDAILPLYGALFEEQAALRHAGADVRPAPRPGAPLLEGAE